MKEIIPGSSFKYSRGIEKVNINVKYTQQTYQTKFNNKRIVIMS